MTSLLSDIEPIVGHWYRRLEDGEIFCVTAVNETHGLVEARLRDGDTEEIEAGNWLAMDLETVAGPEEPPPAAVERGPRRPRVPARGYVRLERRQ